MAIDAWYEGCFYFVRVADEAGFPPLALRGASFFCRADRRRFFANAGETCDSADVSKPSTSGGREERRQQILDRAREVFARKGYHAAKVDDIVAAAGVARGTFYLYFQDKRAIFEELVRRFFHTIAIALRRIEVDQPIEPQVMSNIRSLVDVCLGDPAMTKVLLADAIGLDKEFDRGVHAFYSDIVTLLERSLREGQELGIVQAGDVRVVAHFTLGGVKEVLLQFVRAPVPVDREAVCRDIYSFLSRGMFLEHPSPAKEEARRASASERRRNPRELLTTK